MKKCFFFVLILFLFSVTAGYCFAWICHHQPRIPKIIHYVWVGPHPFPDKGVIAIKTWERFLPGYRLMKWDESNCPYQKSPFALKAYQLENWAFVSDYCRFYALEKYGGIYMDVDQYLFRDSRPLFEDGSSFVGFWQSNDLLVSGIVAGVQGHYVFRQLKEKYESKHTMLTSPEELSAIVFPFYPDMKRGYFSKRSDGSTFYAPNVMIVNLGGEETFGVHGYTGSWIKGREGTFKTRALNDFLNYYAIPITTENKKDYLIPSATDEKKVYRLSDKKRGKILYNEPKNLTVLFEDGKSVRYR